MLAKTEMTRLVPRNPMTGSLVADPNQTVLMLASVRCVGASEAGNWKISSLGRNAIRTIQ